MLFDAFPIVFQEIRGWSEGVGSLPFLGVMTGMMIAMAGNMLDNKRYIRVHNKYKGFAPLETRLPPTMVGALTIPIGLFWFAWTDGTNVHWIVSIIASAPFGFGMVLVFLGIMTYLIDAYTIYAASVLAGNSIIRSIFGTIFPLFTTVMYHNLGIHWATCIPAFLSVACLPFPFIFYRYGARIRRKCKYAAEADDFVRKLADETLDPDSGEKDEQGTRETARDGKLTRQQTGKARDSDSIRTVSTAGRVPGIYQENPYDIDRVNTMNSAITQPRSTSRSRSRSVKGRKKFLGIL